MISGKVRRTIVSCMRQLSRRLTLSNVTYEYQSEVWPTKEAAHLTIAVRSRLTSLVVIDSHPHVRLILHMNIHLSCAVSRRADPVLGRIPPILDEVDLRSVTGPEWRHLDTRQREFAQSICAKMINYRDWTVIHGQGILVRRKKADAFQYTPYQKSRNVLKHAEERRAVPAIPRLEVQAPSVADPNTGVCDRISSSEIGHACLR